MPLPSKISLCCCCEHSFERSYLLPSKPCEAEQVFQNFLRKNDAVSPQNAFTMRAIIADVPAEIARYESEIQRLDDRLGKLHADQKVLERLRDQFMAIVNAPIRRLPTEILVEIFKACEEPREWSEDQVPAHSWDRSARQELRGVAGGDLAAFSQVCSHWRQVVFHTPVLWSHIALDLRCWMSSIETIRTSHEFRWIVPLLEVALARGKEVPLCVDLNAIGACHPLALRTLAASAHRWRSASATVEADMLRELSAMARNLPLLETLWLNVLNESPETVVDLAELFAEAPRLHTIEFYGPLSVVAHWPVEQFRSCRFGALGPADIIPLVAFMDRFENTELYLQLNFEAFQDSDSLLDLTHVVSSIVELDISAMEDKGYETQVSQRVLGEIFDALTVPSLQRLHLCGAKKSGKPLRWPHVEASGLLRRCASRTTLTSLHLDDVIITESELLECLEALPQLQYLLVSDYPGLDGLPGNHIHHLITDSLLKNLTPRLCPESSTSCLVPNLMIVDFKTLGKFTEKVFLEFAQQRTLLAHADHTFECGLRWVPGWRCQLSTLTVKVLEKWMEGGKIIVSWREYDLNDDD